MRLPTRSSPVLGEKKTFPFTMKMPFMVEVTGLAPLRYHTRVANSSSVCCLVALFFPWCSFSETMRLPTRSSPVSGKNKRHFHLTMKMPFMVEVTGLEPTTSWSRTKRATKLRYTSLYSQRLILYNNYFFLASVLRLIFTFFKILRRTKIIAGFLGIALFFVLFKTYYLVNLKTGYN